MLSKICEFLGIINPLCEHEWHAVPSLMLVWCVKCGRQLNPIDDNLPKQFVNREIS